MTFQEQILRKAIEVLTAYGLNEKVSSGLAHEIASSVDSDDTARAKLEAIAKIMWNEVPIDVYKDVPVATTAVTASSGSEDKSTKTRQAKGSSTKAQSRSLASKVRWARKRIEEGKAKAGDKKLVKDYDKAKAAEEKAQQQQQQEAPKRRTRTNVSANAPANGAVTT